jgi:Fe-S cluster assembly iron-binding protein IscA
MLDRLDAEFTITQAARERIEAHLKRSASSTKFPALMLEKRGASILRWQIAYYDRDVVLGPDFKALVVEASGLQIILPQWNFADLVRRAQLDWTGSCYTVNGQSELPIKVG